MFVLPIFFSFVYLCCSFHVSDLLHLKIPHNFLGKATIKVIRFFRKFYPKFSFKLLFNTIDYTKCVFFVIIAAMVFDKKQIVDLTAIVAYTAHYFPIWSGFRNDNKNFISIIFTGFLLDPITGVSMLLAYLVSAHTFGYTSIAITSAMMAGIVKTVVHVVFFDNTDYIEALFFISFGVLAIYKNRKILIYICEKSAKKDIKFYKLDKIKTYINTFKKDVKDKKQTIKFKAEKYKKFAKNGDLYRNYKKFYTSNKKFEEKDRRYN